MIVYDSAKKAKRDASRSCAGLTTCPIDSYSLRGLPTAHRCPECGFRYDRRMCVWPAPNLRQYLGFGIAVYALLLAGAVLSSGSMMLSGPRLIFVSILLSSCGLSLSRGWLAYRNRPFVATAPDGLILRSRGRLPRIIPWESVGEPMVRTIGKRALVKVPLTDGSQAIDVSAFIWDSMSATFFRSAVRNAVQRALRQAERDSIRQNDGKCAPAEMRPATGCEVRRKPRGRQTR